jgi:hypothetical protein
MLRYNSVYVRDIRVHGGVRRNTLIASFSFWGGPIHYVSLARIMGSKGGNMFDNTTVASHYSHGQLVNAITAGIREIGHTRDSISVDDLAAVDEFHI